MTHLRSVSTIPRVVMPGSAALCLYPCHWLVAARASLEESWDRWLVPEPLMSEQLKTEAGPSSGGWLVTRDCQDCQECQAPSQAAEWLSCGRDSWSWRRLRSEEGRHQTRGQRVTSPGPAQLAPARSAQSRSRLLTVPRPPAPTDSLGLLSSARKVSPGARLRWLKTQQSTLSLGLRVSERRSRTLPVRAGAGKLSESPSPPVRVTSHVLATAWAIWRYLETMIFMKRHLCECIIIPRPSALC